MKDVKYCACLLMLLISTPCEAAKTEKSKLPVKDLPLPTHTAFWTNHEGNLTEWGYAANGDVFAKKSEDLTKSEIEKLPVEIKIDLEKSNLLKKRIVYTWKWKDNLIVEDVIFITKASLLGRISFTDSYIHFNFDIGGNREWPWAICNTNTQSIEKIWIRPKNWNLCKQRSSYDGRYLAMYYVDYLSYDDDIAHIAMLDAKTQKMRFIAHLPYTGYVIKALAVSRDGQYVAVLGIEGNVAMINAKEGKVLWKKCPATLADIADPFGAFSNDNKYLYAIGMSGRLNCLDVQTGAIVKQRWATKLNDYFHNYFASGCEISPDGKWLATSLERSGCVQIWDLTDLDKPYRLVNHRTRVYLMSFSPDSKRLAIMGGGKLNIWDIPLTDNKYTKTYDTQDPNNPTPEYMLNLEHDENTPKLVPIDAAK